MQALDLNLASRPFRNNSLLWGGYALATLAVLVFGWWNVTTYLEHARLLRELRDEVGTFESQSREFETRARRAEEAIRRYDLTALQLQTAKANEIIDWKAFSWTRLFNLLERIQPGHVRMNSVRPLFQGLGDETAGGAAAWHGVPVAVEGTARSLEDFTDFEHRLQSDPHFQRVLPESVNKTELGEVLFQLRFLYEPRLTGEDPAAAVAAAPAGAADAAARTEVGEAWPQAEPAGTGGPQTARGGR